MALRTAATATTVWSSAWLRRPGASAGPPGGPGCRRSTDNACGVASTTPNARTEPVVDAWGCAELLVTSSSLVTSRRGAGLSQLDLEQIEQVAHGHDLLQLLALQLDAEAALDVDDQGNDVDRVQAEPLAQDDGVVHVLDAFTLIFFQLLRERSPNGIAIHRGGLSPWAETAPHGRAVAGVPVHESRATQEDKASAPTETRATRWRDCPSPLYSGGRGWGEGASTAVLPAPTPPTPLP